VETEIQRCTPAPRGAIRRYGARSKSRKGDAHAEHQGDRRKLPDQPHRSGWEKRPSRLCCSCLQKQQVNERLRPYSLIDYVYRLRIKTNYTDSAVFTEGPAPGEAGAVHADLVRLAAASLLAHELHVRRLVGVDRTRVLIDGWLKTNLPAGQRLALALRRDLILG
jgi:hypothetical protein